MDLPKLKDLWLYTLTDDDKEFWRQQFPDQGGSVASLRKLLRQKLGIHLPHDRQIANFLAWESWQRNYELHSRRNDLEALRIQLHKTGSNLDETKFQDAQIRQICLLRALAPDQALGLRAICTFTRLNTLGLNRKKFEQILKTKIEAGLEMLIQESRSNPVLHAAVNQLQAAIESQNITGKH